MDATTLRGVAAARQLPTLSSQAAPWLPVLLLASVGLWAYLPTLGHLVGKWLSDPSYSHGFLVPIFAAYLLYCRELRPSAAAGTMGILGLVMIVSAMTLRLFSAIFCSPWLDAISLLPCLIGAIMLFGNIETLRWSWPAIAFLAFMIPLPYRVEIKLSGPLQSVATSGSAALLQILGQPAIVEGHTILLHDVQLGIVEACSGLRMLVTFFTFSTGMALIVTHRSLGERLLLVASAVPIALLTNILRITATGFVYLWSDSKAVHTFCHDAAGWVMMPVCLMFLALEVLILKRLFIDDEAETPRQLVTPLFRSTR